MLTKLLYVFTVIVLCVGVLDCFPPKNLVYDHDEAEHLHVIYSFDRDQLPVRDYLENHPISFHKVMNKLKNAVGIDSAPALYMFIKVFIFLHAFGCIFLIGLLLNQRIPNREMWLWLLFAFANFGAWTQSHVWELRPDWFCIFYSCLAVFLHIRILDHPEKMQTGRAIASGLAMGLATAIMPKSIFIIVPYVLTLFVLTIDNWRECWPKIKRNIVPLAKAHLILGAAASLVLFAAITWEVHEVGLGLSTYIKYVFTINSTKHIVAFPYDMSPINMIREFGPIVLPMAVALGLWFATRLLWLARHNRGFEYQALIAAIIVISFNITVPAFSNGLTWPHYLIPSLLALCVMVALAFSFVAEKLRHFYAGVAIAAVLLGLVSSNLMWNEFLTTVPSNCSTGLLECGKSRLEVKLPEDWTYLSLYPQLMPPKARVWGYYWMLYRDHLIWRDYHNLGLGPDPTSFWFEEMKRSPPDAILFPRANIVLDVIHESNLHEKIDFRWLIGVIKEKYVYYSNGHESLWVKKENAERLVQMGFKAMPEEEQLLN